MARAGRAYPNRPVIARSPDVLAQLVEGRGEALAVLAARSQLAGQAPGAGIAGPVTATKTLTIGQVTASGVAGAASPVRTRRLGRVTGAGKARPFIRWTDRTVGQVTGSGLVLAVRSDPIANRALGAGQPLPVRAGKAIAIHEVAGIGQTRLTTHARGGPIGRASATAVVFPLLATKTIRIGQATGAGSARPVLRRTPPLRVGLPMRSWSARYLGRGAGVEPMSSLSLEYLKFFVTNALGVEPVEIAFTTPGVEPVDGDWTPASWGQTGQGGAEARVQVGPDGAVTLPDGTYQAWVRVTRPDERPVLSSGLVPII
ncbi:hypothetical protein AB0G05_19930 [Nonomuraea wenchangensis]